MPEGILGHHDNLTGCLTYRSQTVKTWRPSYGAITKQSFTYLCDHGHFLYSVLKTRGDTDLKKKRQTVELKQPLSLFEVYSFDICVNNAGWFVENELTSNYCELTDQWAVVFRSTSDDRSTTWPVLITEELIVDKKTDTDWTFGRAKWLHRTAALNTNHSKRFKTIPV